MSIALHIDTSGGADFEDNDLRNVASISTGQSTLASADGAYDAVHQALLAKTNFEVGAAATLGTNLTEKLQDLIAAMFAGTNISVTYDDTTGIITLAAAAPTTTENIQDVVGAMIVDSTSVDATYDDTAGTISLAVIAEAIQDIVGAMFGGSHTAVNATYDDTTGLITLVVTANNFVGVRSYLTADQTINNATDTAVQWTLESWDTNTFHDNVTNNTRHTVPASQNGKYAISGMLTFSAASGGNRRSLYIRKNGATTLFTAHEYETAFGGSFPIYIPFYVEADLAVADYIEVIAYQDSGGAIQLTRFDYNTQFQMRKIG